MTQEIINLHKINKNKLNAIFFMVISCFFASILVSIVYRLSKEFHVFFIVMMRSFFAVILFIPYIIKDYKKILYTSKIHIHITRAFNGLASMVIWFYVISSLPLSEAVSISFIVPILTTFTAIIFFKEKVKPKYFLAGFIGFVGILIILRPGFREFRYAHLAAILTAVLWTLSNVFIKTMTKTEDSKTIVFYMSLVMLTLSIPLSIPYFVNCSLEDFILFFLLGLFSNLTHVFLCKAYSKADMSVVQPFDFTRLIFTAIIAFFAFGEVIDKWVFVGSLVILFGNLIVIPKNKTKKNVKNL